MITTLLTPFAAITAYGTGNTGGAQNDPAQSLFEAQLNAARTQFFSPMAVTALADVLPMHIVELGDFVPQPPTFADPGPMRADGGMSIAPRMPLPVPVLGETRTFRHSVTGNFQLVRQGANNNIWLPVGRSIPDAILDRAVADFDIIYANMTGTGGFGAHANVVRTMPYNNVSRVGDVDDDGRINVVFSQMSGNRGGFFNSVDFFDTFNGQQGNRLDMIHVNLDLLGDANIESGRLLVNNIMAHELSHFLFFVHFGMFVPNTRANESLWFNEAIAELAGTQFGDPLRGSQVGLRLRTAIQNSYAGSGYGDFLAFNNSIKNYSMSNLFSALMFRRYGDDFARTVFEFFAEEFPLTNTYAQNQAREAVLGHNGVMNEIFGRFSSFPAGDNALRVAYTIFMENFASDGGNVRLANGTTQPTARFSAASTGASSLWGLRPIWGITGGIAWVNNVGGGFTNAAAETAFPTFNTNGNISLQGYGSGRPARGATHEMLYRIQPGAANATMLSITAPTGGTNELYYVVVPNDPRVDVTNPANSFYHLGTGGAEVFALPRGEAVTINTGGRGAWLFVVTFNENVNRSGPTFAWQAPLDDQGAVDADYADLTWNRIRGANVYQSDVRTNLNFPTVGGQGSTITWSSMNTAVVSNTGVVTRPAAGAGNITVTLSATIERGGISRTRIISVFVAEEMSDADAVTEDAAWLTWDRIRSMNVAYTAVTSRVVLPVTGGLNGSAVSWVSSDPTVISNTGLITRPDAGDANAVVTLTATVARGGASQTVTFTLTVLAEAGQLLVRAIGNPSAYINLNTETIHGIPFAVAEFSINGGNRWRRGNLPTGNAWHNLFNRGLHLSVRAANGLTINFPPIERRPRANSERLRPWYSAETWTLRARPNATNNLAAPPAEPGKIYELSWGNPANGRLEANATWEELPNGFAINIIPPPARGVRHVAFFRSTPTAENGVYTPASRPFRVRPAAFRRATNAIVNYGNETIRTRVGQEFSVDGGLTWTATPTETVNNRVRPLPLDVSTFLTSPSITEIHFRNGATGRRTQTEAQVIILRPRAQLADILPHELNILPNGRIDAQALRPFHVQIAAANGTRWRALPRPTQAGTFSIRRNHTVRRDRTATGGFTGYAASETGTLTIDWGVSGQNAAGNNIIGVVRAVLTPYGVTPPSILSLLPPLYDAPDYTPDDVPYTTPDDASDASVVKDYDDYDYDYGYGYDYDYVG